MNGFLFFYFHFPLFHFECNGSLESPHQRWKKKSKYISVFCPMRLMYEVQNIKVWNILNRQSVIWTSEKNSKFSNSKQWFVIPFGMKTRTHELYVAKRFTNIVNWWAIPTLKKWYKYDSIIIIIIVYNSYKWRWIPSPIWCVWTDIRTN